MSRVLVGLFLTFLLLIHESRHALGAKRLQPLAYGCGVNVSVPSIHSGEAFTRQMSIPPASDLELNITDVPTDISFIIVQIHTYQYNVTLSYDKVNLNKVSRESIFGTNLGLFVKRQSNAPLNMYLKNDNVRSVDSLLVITGYDDRAPVPGGCNMEFDTEIAPYLKVDFRNDFIVVDMQPASLSTIVNEKFSCDRSSIKHTVYQMFLPEQDFSSESYFAGIESMLTVSDIMKNGRKLSAGWHSPMRRVHSAYIGVGSVYVVVSSYRNYSSAYVPTFSYSCSPLLCPDSCQILHGILPNMFCAAAFFLGTFSVFFRRRWINIDNLIPVFVVGSTFGYILGRGGAYNTEINLLFGLVGGLIMIIISTLVNRKLDGTGCARLMCSLGAGLFFASVIYTQLPDALLFCNDFAFWTFFATITVFFTFILSCCQVIGLSIIFAIFGSLLMILPIDYYVSSCLKYIIINIMRRATVPDFSLASVHPPYQTADALLTALWCIIAFCSCLKFYRSGIEREENPEHQTLFRFPPSAPQLSELFPSSLHLPSSRNNQDYISL